jgi:hypothetical protein
MTMRDDVMTTVVLWGDDPSADEQTIVESLMDQGYSAIRAEVLNAFVPLGLARAVIARLQVTPPLKPKKTARIHDYARDRWLEVRLADIPEYVAARSLGEETFSTGIIPREQFKAASQVSAELNLVNVALNAGKTLSGAKFSQPVLMRLAQTPGFKEWYEEVRPKAWKRFLSW